MTHAALVVPLSSVCCSSVYAMPYLFFRSRSKGNQQKTRRFTGSSESSSFRSSDIANRSRQKATLLIEQKDTHPYNQPTEYMTMNAKLPKEVVRLQETVRQQQLEIDLLKRQVKLLMGQSGGGEKTSSELSTQSSSEMPKGSSHQSFNDEASVHGSVDGNTVDDSDDMVDSDNVVDSDNEVDSAYKKRRIYNRTYKNKKKGMSKERIMATNRIEEMINEIHPIPQQGPKKLSPKAAKKFRSVKKRNCCDRTKLRKTLWQQFEEQSKAGSEPVWQLHLV